MKKPLVIFGAGDIAQLAHFYFCTDSNYEVVAFTVDAAYITVPEFCGLPVVPFEELPSRFLPDAHQMFVALSYSKLNEVRKEKYLAAKALGYRLATYVSSRATVLNGGMIGDNCFIFEDNTIQPFVKIGNNVTIWSGNHIGHHSVIESHNFISSHVVISGHCHIKSYTFLGVNATIGHQVTIAEGTLLGAGTITTKDTVTDGVYVPQKSILLEKKSSEIKL